MVFCKLLISRIRHPQQLETAFEAPAVLREIPDVGFLIAVGVVELPSVLEMLRTVELDENELAGQLEIEVETSTCRWVCADVIRPVLLVWYVMFVQYFRYEQFAERRRRRAAAMRD